MTAKGKSIMASKEAAVSGPATVLFVCSPSLGILDSWLPVIFSLREKKADLRFVFLSPKLRSIQEIDLDDTLIGIAASVFDILIFPNHRGNWTSAESFREAKRLADAHPPSTRIKRIIKKVLTAWGIFDLVSKINNFLSSGPRAPISTKNAEIDNIINAKNLVVLFDLHETKKDYLGPLLSSLKQAPHFSLLHGIGPCGVPVDQEGTLKTGIRTRASPENANTTAFLISDRERPFYTSVFGLRKEQLLTTGIPRHEEAWVEKITALDQKKLDSSFRNFIFVISRPCTSSYFPRNRKLEAIKDLKIVAEKYGLFVVVKAHPKERDDGTFDEIFGAAAYGDRWSISRAHPFSLGNNCQFAVSFYSGVAVDMVRLGIPVIERLDLRGLRGLSEARDEMGNHISAYHYWGLVLSASDSNQFLDHVAAILDNREAVVQALQSRYSELFPSLEDINNKISARISAAFDSQIE